LHSDFLRLTYFADVAGGRLAAVVVVELVIESAVHHYAGLVAGVVVGFVVSPTNVAACAGCT